LRIVFFGSSDFAIPSLKALKVGGFAPLLVVTKPDSPRGRGRKIYDSEVKLAANELSLPCAQPVDAHGPEFLAELKAIKPDLWLYSEIQWDNLLDPVAHEAQRRMPKGGIYQHTTNRSYWSRIKGELTRDYVESLPTQPNVLRCQFACQWNGDERSERYFLNARVLGEMATLCAERGMRGLTVWGEPSPYHATVELSYLAFARFSWEPSLTWDRFLAEDAAPLLGGMEAAGEFVSMAEEIDANRILPLERLRDLRDAAMAHRASDEAGRRWLSLEDQIARRIYMSA